MRINFSTAATITFLSVNLDHSLLFTMDSWRINYNVFLINISIQQPKLSHHNSLIYFNSYSISLIDPKPSHNKYIMNQGDEGKSEEGRKGSLEGAREEGRGKGVREEGRRGEGEEGRRGGGEEGRRGGGSKVCTSLRMLGVASYSQIYKMVPVVLD